MTPQFPDPNTIQGTPPPGLPVAASVPGVPAYYTPYAPIPQTNSLHRYLVFLGRKWYLVALSILVFVSLAFAYENFWPQSYVSTAHLWAAGKVGLQLREGATYNEEGQTFAGTQVELLQSPKIMDRAFARVLAMPGVTIPTNTDGKPKLVTLKVSQLPKSAVLELKAKGPTETYTRAFLDAVMDEFLAYKREIRSATSGDTYTSVSEQITKQEADLKTAQDKLTTYQRDNNVAVLEEQAKAASAYLTQLLAESSRLKVEHQLLEAMTPDPSPLTSGPPASSNSISAFQPFSVSAFAPASSLSSNSLSAFQLFSFSAFPGVAPDAKRLTDRTSPTATPPAEFLFAQQELEKIKIIRARLSKYLRPKHPKIVKLDEQIAQGEKLVEFFSQQSRDQLANAKQTVKLKLDRTQESIKEWEAKVNNASERIAECQRQKLEVERLQSLNDRLLGLLQTVDVTRNLDQENITILDRASEIKPGKLPFILLLALCSLLGLGAGLGLVMVVEKTDDRLLSLEELAALFEEWIIGQVPEVPNAKKKKRPALLDVKDTRHMFAESWRNLRSALLYLPVQGDRPKVLLITSAIPNEGKSTVAANLARALAFGGARVLLVDGDLRKGTLDTLMELNREPGLAELLHQPAELDRVIQTNCLPNLAFISRGGDLSNPGDAFLTPKLDSTLLRFRKEYDYVLIDSCPVFASDDATTLAPKVDGTIFVVRHRFTRAAVAREALDLLYARQAKVLGLVLNRADANSKGYKYYKYREYAHKPAAV